MSFADILGHQQQVATLRAAFAKGRLHHAYLFFGAEGIGKRTIALALARALHCLDASGDFCDRCINCKRIADGNHPDVRLIEPLVGKKEIGIQQIRDLEKELNYQSFTGGRKIMVVDPCTLMNLSAQNALLKTLEEPPANAMLILIAANAGALLPTVRSRCLQISFGALERAWVADYLVQKQGSNPQQAQFLAALSLGSLGMALKLNDSQLFEKRQVWAAMLTSLGAGDYRGASEAAEKLAAKKEESLKFLEWAETFYRDLLVYAAGQMAEDSINPDLLAQIQVQSAGADIEHWLAVFAQTVGAGGRIQRNLNRRMVLEKLLFDVVGAR